MSDGRKYLLLDTETTGLVKPGLVPLNQQPHMIEFYGVLVNDACEPIEELEFLCRPPVTISQEVIDITKITNEMVANEPPVGMWLPTLRTLLGKADAVVAHNLSFDYEIISNEFLRHDTDPDDVSRIWPKIRICTVEQTEWMLGIRLNLETLHSELGLGTFKNAHRAKNDVQALLRCFKALKERGDI